MLRQVDSSLLDEWERMRDPSWVAAAPADEARPPRPPEPPDVTRDAKAFTAAIRARAFALLRAWSIGRDEDALEALDSRRDGEDEEWTAERLKAARDAHAVEHAGLRLDPEARNLRHTSVEATADETAWRVQQMLVDAADLNDWVLELDVDLPASREAGRPVVRMLRLGPLV